MGKTLRVIFRELKEEEEKEEGREREHGRYGMGREREGERESERENTEEIEKTHFREVYWLLRCSYTLLCVVLCSKPIWL